MSSNQTSECPICVESFNKTFRKRITCSNCDLECCKQCFLRYICDPDHYFRCMGCSVEFDRSGLYTRLGNSFMSSRYRDIRQEMLYEKEKALFPATQILVEKKIEISKLEERRDNLDKEFEQIRKQRAKTLLEFRKSTETMPVSAAIDKFLEMSLRVESADEEQVECRQSIVNEIDTLKHSSTVKAKTYILACPYDSCKGMLSREGVNEKGNFVCSICSKTTCAECQLGIQQDAHECDPNVLESLKYVRETSKQCPSCSVMIFKISGCNQFFCTHCFASFDWRTLRLNSGVIHNPHHAEWLRANRNRPREVADIQCGRELTITIATDMDDELKREIRRTTASQDQKQIWRSEADYLFEAIRVGVHHNHISIMSLSRNPHGQHTNQELRINLLMNNTNEDYFKQEIQRRDKANSKRNELLHIVMTYRDSLTDIIWPFVGTRKNIKEWIAMIQEIHALEAYVDTCFQNVSDAYGSITHSIMGDRPIR